MHYRSPYFIWVVYNKTVNQNFWFLRVIILQLYYCQMKTNKNGAKEKEIRYQCVTKNTWPHTLILTTYPKALLLTSRDRQRDENYLHTPVWKDAFWWAFRFTDSHLLHSSPRRWELVKATLIWPAEGWRHITKINVELGSLEQDLSLWQYEPWTMGSVLGSNRHTHKSSCNSKWKHSNIISCWNT